MTDRTPSVPPAFIVGVGRSGTTLLVNLLGSDPLLAPIYEAAFIRNLLLLCDWASWFWGQSPSRRCSRVLFDRVVWARFSAVCEKYRQKCEEFREMVLSKPDPEVRRAQGVKQKYERFPSERQAILFDMEVFIEGAEGLIRALQRGPLKEEEIYGLARQHVDRLFSMQCGLVNKPFWVNKTPRLLLCLRYLPKLYPGARCIHIVRDGRDVAVSNLSLSWGPDNVRDAARRWRSRLAARKDFDPARLAYMEVHYEELIESPRRVLEEIFSFVGLRADVDGILSGFKVYDQRVGVWRTALGPEDRKVFAREAGDLLIELGYEKDYSWLAS